jgi:CMP/dCMP kinase
VRAHEVERYGVITFDGPAASGKSSVAQRVACRLAIPFVSSGLLYRAATHAAAAAGADLDDETAVLRVLAGHDVVLEPGTDGNRIVLDGTDVSAALHTDAVDAGVSQVAAHPGVRSWVSQQLQRVAPPFAIDGRDMGSVVFPQAAHKFYLTASPHERARRRVGERSADLAAVEAAIARRDRLDAKQLVPAPDAFHVDTDGLDLDQVVARVLQRLGLDVGGRA